MKIPLFSKPRKEAIDPVWFSTPIGMYIINWNPRENDGGKFMDLKDWSDDDTESGDDNVFTPRIPQLIADKSPLDDDF